MEIVVTALPTLVTAVVLTTLTVAPEAAYRFARQTRRRFEAWRRGFRRQPEAPRRVVRTYGRSWCE